MRYSGFAYRQVRNGPVMFSFVGTSCEIDRWAKVPTKLASAPRNFQRAVIPKHVDEIRNFFADGSEVNSSPTSLILGISPDCQSLVKICRAGTNTVIDPLAIGIAPSLCDLVISFDPWPSENYSGDDEALNREIEELYAKVRSSYEEGTEDGGGDDESDDGELDEGASGGIDSDEDVNYADDDEDSGDETAEEEGEEDDVSSGMGDSANGESAIDDNTPERESDPIDASLSLNPDARSLSEAEAKRDADRFLALLSRSRVAHFMGTNEYRTLSKHRREGLRDMFKDDLKPGLIIDGQHRIRGTAKRGEFPFSVLLMPFASWGELAFQFIVNNGTAKKVGDGLLISIVGDSLSPADLAETDTRLNRAGVKVSLIQAVMYVQNAENPFAGMLNFSVPGELGFLDAKAMKSKVVEQWWGTRGQTGQKPNMKTLSVHDHRKWDLYELFGNVCTGPNRGDKIRDWQDSKKWFEYFRVFWEAIADNYKPRLWPAASSKWLPANGRPSTDEHREREKLMRVTVLGLLQTAVLQVWADNTNRKRTQGGKTMDGFKITPSKFKQEIASLVRLVPYDFFTELKYTGFDASKDLRRDFVEQLIALLEMRKEFPAIKASHRFWQST
jgi:hypothetical protein